MARQDFIGKLNARGSIDEQKASISELFLGKGDGTGQGISIVELKARESI